MSITREQRKARLKVYELAIRNKKVLDGYSTLEKQICHYDQLVMVDRQLTKNEERLKILETELEKLK